MKGLLKFSFILFAFAFTWSCSNAPEGQKVEAEAAQETPVQTETASATYTVDVANSTLNWVGSKPTGNHSGTLSLSSGEIGVSNGEITSGSFELDMNSIANSDLPDDKKGNLEGHLKSGDFFEVEKFPTGSFVITSVAAAQDVEGATHTVTGNLTLKGITKSVSVPANVNISDERITAVTPSFTIDRTEWDINFKSTKIGELADKAINDQIGLVLKLIASSAPVQ